MFRGTVEKPFSSLVKFLDRGALQSEELEDLHLYHNGEVLGQQEFIRWHWESSQTFSFQAKRKSPEREGRVLLSSFPTLKRGTSTLAKPMTPLSIVIPAESAQSRAGSFRDTKMSKSHRSFSRLNTARLPVQVSSLTTHYTPRSDSPSVERSIPLPPSHSGDHPLSRVRSQRESEKLLRQW